MNRLEFEAENLEAALDFAEQELRVGRKYISINVLEPKPSSIRVEAIFDIDIKKEIYNYLSNILQSMDLKYTIDISSEENTINYKIETSHNSLLIGRDGKTLRAFQYMAKQLLYHYNQDKFRVSLDIGGYKEKKILQLEIFATKAASKVVKKNVAITLPPMNAYERRIVHAKLAQWRDVTTESKGEDPNRAVVIKPVVRQ